eukprot:CAMPEP_0194756360 /NCGR_PEP_ID=MMETSP0323_2-20130528/10067_1 /TAXON_ID=2866 ORGANISM="Crypthecodinium cohnii, Strain Seligo" /NCGR_SAMPLE_ID=MMETSP0323_2 /ASSEMBLY_ACC=CAM_ASM_000346 /LENGTH=251 /DNA_ID=CAMNT_0039675823 /DNA_START=123 /DNA_END=874 /DNA_ORIENTATION=-
MSECAMRSAKVLEGIIPCVVGVALSSERAPGLNCRAFGVALTYRNLRFRARVPAVAAPALAALRLSFGGKGFFDLRWPVVPASRRRVPPLDLFKEKTFRSAASQVFGRALPFTERLLRAASQDGCNRLAFALNSSLRWRRHNRFKDRRPSLRTGSLWVFGRCSDFLGVTAEFAFATRPLSVALGSGGAAISTSSAVVKSKKSSDKSSAGSLSSTWAGVRLIADSGSLSVFNETPWTTFVLSSFTLSFGSSF